MQTNIELIAYLITAMRIDVRDNNEEINNLKIYLTKCINIDVRSNDKPIIALTLNASIFTTDVRANPKITTQVNVTLTISMRTDVRADV